MLERHGTAVFFQEKGTTVEQLLRNLGMGVEILEMLDALGWLPHVLSPTGKASINCKTRMILSGNTFGWEFNEILLGSNQWMRKMGNQFFGMVQPAKRRSTESKPHQGSFWINALLSQQPLWKFLLQLGCGDCCRIILTILKLLVLICSN